MTTRQGAKLKLDRAWNQCSLRGSRANEQVFTFSHTLYCYCIKMAYQVFGNDTSIHVKFGHKLLCSLKESANKGHQLIVLVMHGRFFLTNRPQFSMVYTLIDHRNDVIKCSELKCGSWFQCRVLNILWRHFMVYNSVERGKLWSICFLQ